MSTPTATGAAVAQPPAGPADKVRLRFHKGGSLRWLSHHDLMRAFERMVRRARIAFRRTQGFNPHPRIVFALSLPLGVVGRAEVADIELDEVIPPDELLARLREHCPPGLQLLELSRVPAKASAQVRSLSYGLELPPARLEATRAALPTLLAQSEFWMNRRRPSGGANSRHMDLRPFIRDLRLTELEPAWLEMDLWLTQAGTARPEEILTALGLADLLDQGAILHRTRLELHEPTCPEG